jgi:hypothetical protein
MRVLIKGKIIRLRNKKRKAQAERSRKDNLKPKFTLSLKDNFSLHLPTNMKKTYLMKRTGLRYPRKSIKLN